MIDITAIKLPESFDNYRDEKGNKAEFIEPLSKINIFVGSNNSGKSRFMRELSSQNSFNVKFSNLKEINEKVSIDLQDLVNTFKTNNISTIAGISLEELEKLSQPIQNTLNTKIDNHREIRKELERWSGLQEYEKVVPIDSSIYNYNQGADYFNYLVKKIKNDAIKLLNLVESIPISSEETHPQIAYIPTLRGLRPLDDSHSDVYKHRTFEDYFNQEDIEPPEIFTGLSLYKEMTELLLDRNAERQSISKYQEFISNSLFEGKSVQLIPSLKDKVITVKIGKEEDRPIHHLGDGIQSAIILSFLPFTRKEPTFFFIEEPEMYMHPGLQRKILEFFNSCPQHKFFLTTHSNHFLDLTIDFKDVSVFTFTKIFDESDADELTPNFKIEAVDSACESSLELLGVRNSSVFLVNATIWVEGITDRWYLREMLNSYMNYLAEKDSLLFRAEEDTHYSFVEYGGANITHWSFLDKEKHPIAVNRLCAKAMVVIDKDGEKKEERKKELQEKLGDRLIILPCREIENILPPTVIKQVVAEYENDENLEFRDFTQESYADKYLGTFIESKVLKNSSSRKGGYKADSGTIKDKGGFCEKALPKIRFQDLSPSAKKVIEEIYEFIKKRNS